jgi:hypothetical protein
MHQGRFSLLIGVVLLSSLAARSIAAQTSTPTTQVTPQQERTIYTTIMREQMTKSPQPPDWAPQIGADVPQQIELFDMPQTIDAAALRDDRYTVVNGRVVIVEPNSRRVLYVIGPY